MKTKGFLVILVGLACSGKSTISNKLKSKLHNIGVNIQSIELDKYIKDNFPKEGFVLDIDTRLKLDEIISKDLKDKVTNGQCFVLDAGNPLEKGRNFYKEKVSKVYIILIDTPLHTCIVRDIVRSLKNASPISNWIYFKSIKSLVFGEKKNYLQGISIPFEKPANADFIVTKDMTLDTAVTKILNILI